MSKNDITIMKEDKYADSQKSLTVNMGPIINKFMCISELNITNVLAMLFVLFACTILTELSLLSVMFLMFYIQKAHFSVYLYLLSVVHIWSIPSGSQPFQGS